jgi:hypothetical protein
MRIFYSLIIIISAQLSLLNVNAQTSVTDHKSSLNNSQSLLMPCSITVNAAQSLSFGSFSLLNSGSNGGTVTVGWDGSRTSTGDVILLSGSEAVSPAIFDLELCPGRDVTITYPPTTMLTSSNGNSVILKIGPTEFGESGATIHSSENNGFITQLRVGGTLIIGPNNSNPGGAYNISFNIEFNQQ